MKNNLEEIIINSDDKIQYDNCVKKVLSEKEILSNIMYYLLEEFKDIDIKTIMNKCIGNVGINEVQ